MSEELTKLQKADLWLNNNIGKIGSVANGIAGIMDTSLRASQIADTSRWENQIAGMSDWRGQNFYDNSSYLSSLSAIPTGPFSVSGKDLGPSNGQVAGYTATGAMQGAMAGAQFGWLGAGIGALVGGAAGFIGGRQGQRNGEITADYLNSTYDFQERQNEIAREVGADQAHNSIYNSLYATRRANGGGIHIKKSNEGKFTAAAKRHNMTVQEFANHVLAKKNADKYSATMRKRANFARNASKWKHAEGGNLYGPGGLLRMFAEGLSYLPSKQQAQQAVHDSIQTASNNYEIKYPTFGGFGGGMFGGAGASGRFEYSPSARPEDYDYVRNTPIVDEVTFSQAYANARNAGLPTFEFNGQTYTTDYDPNAKLGPVQTESNIVANLREVLDKERNTIPDSTRLEPWIGQIPGEVKRVKAKGGQGELAWTPSEDIINYIKEAEGFRGKWYKDGNGVDTIGYGFTGAEMKKKYPNGMTKEQADAELRKQIAKRVPTFVQATPGFDTLANAERDSLFDYYYNIGHGNYTKGSPKLQAALAVGDRQGIVSNLDYGYYDKKNPGLKKRRDYERALFGDFTYDMERIKESNAPFIRRLNNNDRRTVVNPDLTVSTHRLGYVTDGNEAVIFPEVQEIDDELVDAGRAPYDPYLSALASRDTVRTTIPFAEHFTREYKNLYPGYFAPFNGPSYSIGIQQAEGGELNTGNMNDYNTHGAYFGPTKLVSIDAGGTHEQNPNGGVQYGTDEQGIPNLVEEGETVYDDYVFSDRLKPSKSELKAHNLPEKYEGKTFAELSEILTAEGKNRPNDAVSNAGSGVFLDRLLACQEEHKQKLEEARLKKELEKMSPEELMQLGAALGQQGQMQAQHMPQQVPPQMTQAPVEQATAEQMPVEQVVPETQEPVVAARGGLLKQGPDGLVRSFVWPGRVYGGPNIGYVKYPIETTGGGNWLWNYQYKQDGSFLPEVFQSPYSGFNIPASGVGAIGSSATTRGHGFNSTYADSPQYYVNSGVFDDEPPKPLESGIDISPESLGSPVPAAMINDTERPKPKGSAEVRRIQEGLNKQGFNLDVDGIMGPKTRAAMQIAKDRDATLANINARLGTALDDGLLERLPGIASSTGAVPKNAPGLAGIPASDSTPGSGAKSGASTGTGNAGNSDKLNTALRYAGVGYDLLSGIQNILQEPDEVHWNRLKPRYVAGNLALQKMNYNPLDYQLMANQINANNAATTRAIGNAGLGPATGATLLAAGYNGNQALGNGFWQTQQANDQRKAQILGQNNAAEQAMQNFAFRRDAYNTGIGNQFAQLNNQLAMDETLRNIGFENDKYNAVSQSMNALAGDLAGMGRENFIMNQIKSNSALFYGVGKDGWAYYKGWDGIDWKRNPTTGETQAVVDKSEIPQTAKKEACGGHVMLKKYKG